MTQYLFSAAVTAKRTHTLTVHIHTYTYRSDSSTPLLLCVRARARGWVFSIDKSWLEMRGESRDEKKRSCCYYHCCCCCCSCCCCCISTTTQFLFVGACVLECVRGSPQCGDSWPFASSIVWDQIGSICTHHPPFIPLAQCKDQLNVDPVCMRNVDKGQ